MSITMSLDLYVEVLTNKERLAILDDYEDYRVSGTIGDDPLRQHTERYMEQNGMAPSNIILMMEAMAGAANRYYAQKYIDEHFSNSTS